MNAKHLIFAALIGSLSIFAAATERMTYAAGSHVLSVGDSMSRVLEFMGEPASKEDVQNKSGAHEATNWYYNVDGKTVRFLIVNGKIGTIEETR